jgi:undecaprenyl-diphosphatase
LASAAIVGVVLVVTVPLITSTAWRVTVITAGVLFVLAIGWSRIYLGVHWFTDVVAGWLTGIAWLALCLTVREVWRLTVGSLALPPADRPAGPAPADQGPGERPAP